MNKKDKEVERAVYAFAAQSNVKPHIGGRCACGGISVAAKEDFSLHHTKPTCDEFDKKPHDEYLHFVRMKLSD